MENFNEYIYKHGVTEYLLTGENNTETILFVHGVGANLRQFKNQHEFFSKNYRVLSISLRGHGNSKYNKLSNSEFTVMKMREDIIELLDYLGIREINFVGNSAGGIIGYELIKYKPELIKSIVTFGTTAELRLSKFVVGLISSIDKFMIKLNSSGYFKFISKYSSKNKEIQYKVYNWLMDSKDSIPLFRKNIGNYTYLDVIKNIDIPYMLIKGAFDSDINTNLFSTLTAMNNNENCSVVEIEDAGHFSNLDNPIRFNDILKEVLETR